MERAGTGLSDVAKFAREADGAAVFRLPPGGTDFLAELYQPEASGVASRVARDTRPIGTYVINILRFAALPECVSRVRVGGTLSNIAKAVPLDEAGTLLLRGDEIWSFAPPEILAAILRPVMTEASVRQTRREAIEVDPGESRVLSWLLRKHFEAHLRGLARHGFMLEPNRRTNRRAYFVGVKGGPRLHVYDTAHRRNVPREVVKQRGIAPRVWFENEGIAYELTRFASSWGIRVKPFYMFTGPDARTPLANFARTAKATRRMRFDRNESVGSDLTFWARFLAQGAPIINIGQSNVEDLLVEGGFITIDVPEEGLIEDDDSDQGQMPA
jgi:hypothetical protein